MSFTRYQAERECLRRALNDAGDFSIEELRKILIASGLDVPSDLPRHLKAIGAQSRKRKGHNSQWEWFIPTV
jgi:hypothetical protein